jgi:hypothetical protein
MKRVPLEIPQIIAIVKASSDGRMNLKKDVRTHLKMGTAEKLYLDTEEEVRLTAKEGKGEEVSIERGNRITLLERAIEKLALTDGGSVGFVQRGDSVAIKRVRIEEVEGEWANSFDTETPIEIVRNVETNPDPDKALPELERQNNDLKLRHDINSYLKGRQTLEAWMARRLIGTPEGTDEGLRERLIEERLREQGDEGSWEGCVTTTARALRELADLGMTKKDPAVERGARWLLERPGSPHNPGMLFLRDDLVHEQVELVERRQAQERGSRPRFRKLLSSENKIVTRGDPMIKKACGPRIMWPNSMVLESLLKLGYEDDERVRSALETLLHGYWCECGYQHGLSGWRKKEPYTLEEVEAIEKEFMNQYRYGGLSDLDELAEKDLSHKVGTKIPRVSEKKGNGVTVYPLLRDDHIQGCEMMTTRALYLAKEERVRRLAEAYLWRLAGKQHEDGHFFTLGRSAHYVNHSFHDLQPGYLDLFARYDHPVSRLVIYRMLRWIVENQNADGSWGEITKDVSTLAVLRALRRIGLI